VLAAYNAGEGTVREWLKNEAYSSDGVILRNVPYAETKGYMKKIKKYYTIYRKIYLTNLGK
jgi:soluble lytic murein transglycosylase